MYPYVFMFATSCILKSNFTTIILETLSMFDIWFIFEMLLNLTSCIVDKMFMNIE
jgi:hypothetical protein